MSYYMTSRRRYVGRDDSSSVQEISGTMVAIDADEVEDTLGGWF
jgi:hypothetical protein